MRLLTRTGAWLAFSLLLGLGIALLDGQGSLLHGWAAYSLLIGLGLGSLCLFQRLLKLDAEAGRSARVAFLLRLAVGVALTLLLPVLGHQDEAAQPSQAGYFYQDAFARDRRAWTWVQAGQPLTAALDPERSKDQYGSMLFLSMAVYRFLSPDAHRQMLILALTATAGAWGVLFLWKAAGLWFGKGAARGAGWIFALYPEAILLGASQMREGFVLSGVAMAFWGVIQAAHERGERLGQDRGQGLAPRRLPGLPLQRADWGGWVWFGVGFLFLLVFHPPSALVALVILAGVWLLDPFKKRVSVRQSLFFTGLLALTILFVFLIWSRLPSLQGKSPAGVLSSWLANNFNFQAYKSVRASGRLQQLIEQAGDEWKGAIVISYGIAQPVLPGAIFENSRPIWMGINTLRGLGWYALAPFLIYSLFAALRALPGERKTQMIWLSLAMGAWILISSANAGGDLWDNPRYRVIFLAFQALLAAWAWNWASEHRDVWLKRLLLTETIFVLFFLQWYASRYTRLFSKLPFWEMIAAILALSALILAAGWVRDRRKKVYSKQ